MNYELCYNIPGESVYGELTLNTIKPCSAMMSQFSGDIYLCDLGSGSCRTLLLLTDMVNAKKSVGIERSAIRHFIAKNVIDETGDRRTISVNVDILKITALPSRTTHVFSFDKVFPPDVLEHMRSLILKSNTLRCVATTRKQLLKGISNWNLVATICGRMRGSGQRCSVYIFHFKKK